MVEIEYKPIKKIILYEILHYDFKQFVDMVTKFSKGMIVLKWCNGIVFASEMIPYTPDTIQDRIEGTVHWNFVEFAYMPKFVHTIVSENGVPVMIVDVSTNNAIKDVTNWLKKQPQWNPAQMATT